MQHEYVLFLDSDAFVRRHSDWLEKLMVRLCKLKPVLKAPGFCARNYNLINCFQVLHSMSNCAPRSRSKKD